MLVRFRQSVSIVGEHQATPVEQDILSVSRRARWRALALRLHELTKPLHSNPETRDSMQIFRRLLQNVNDLQRAWLVTTNY